MIKKIMSKSNSSHVWFLHFHS